MFSRMRAKWSRGRSVKVDRALREAVCQPLEERCLLANAVFWDGGGNGTSWTDALNWSGNVVPGSGDDVTISVAANPTIAITSGTQWINSLVCDETLTLSGAMLSMSTTAQINGAFTLSSGTLSVGTTSQINGTFTISSGTVYVAGNMTINGACNWTGGTMGGTGKTIIASTGTLNLNGSNVSLNGSMDNNGRINWSNGGTLGMTSATLTNNGQINYSGTGNSSINSTSGTNLIANNGTINQGGSATATIAIPFNNAGTVNVQAGTLSVSGGGTDSGGFAIGSGATLGFAGGTHSLSTTATISGAGGIVVNAGTLTVNGAVNVGGPATFSSGLVSFLAVSSLGNTTVSGATVSFNAAAGLSNTTVSGGIVNFNAAASINGGSISSGTLSGSADVTVTGIVAWTGGTMSGAGKTIIASTGTLNLSGSGNVALSRSMDNKGTIAWSGGGAVNMTNATLTNNGQINYSSSASPYINLTSGTNLVVNNGTINKGGSGWAVIAVPFNNVGTVNVQVGTLNLVGGGTDNSGFSVSSGATLGFVGGTHSLGVAAGITGAGKLTASAGTVTVNSVVNVGTAAFSGATALFNNTFTAGSMTMGSGSVTFAAAATITDSANCFGGSLSSNAAFSAGSLSVSGAMLFTLGASSTAVVGTYTQTAGTLAVTLANTTPGSGYGRIVASGAASLGGNLVINLAGTPAMGDSFDIISGSTVSGTFATISPPAASGGGYVSTTYRPTQARLRMAPTLVHVDATAPGNNDGSSWTDAFTDLAAAMTQAASGVDIRVAGGTYKPTTGTDQYACFQLKSGVGIYGGYAGYGAADPDVRDLAHDASILSGDIGTVGNGSDNSRQVLFCSHVTSTAIVDGFTVTGASSSGIYLMSASPTIRNCVVSENAASTGAGMYSSYSSNPTLINCTFSGNTASSSGGGIYNTTSNPTLINCTFSGNTASSSGGGIYNTASNPTLINCIVWGSGSSPIYNSSSTALITYSDIEGGYIGTGNVNVAPLFVRSSWTGPDGLFGTPDDEYGDLRLRGGSPVLDIGSNQAVPTGVTTDLIGNTRIQNGRVDLGALEGPVSTPTPKTIFVDLGAVGANTGTSWNDAFNSVQAALLAATDGDTIRVAEGIYTPTTTTDRTISFVLKSAVAMYGGYAGYGASDPNTRDTVLYPTVLSGDIGVPGISSDNSYHIVTAAGVASSCILDGITFAGGNANGSGTNQGSGGALFATGSSPSLTNCTFTGNSASGTSGGGGGVYNVTSSPTLTNCTFTGNSASYGGGMYNFSSSPALADCAFKGNTSSSDGGAIYDALFSSPTLVSCTFSGNNGKNAGGMYNSSSSPTLSNCAFSGNIAGNIGGGMYNDSSSPTLTNCTFQGNGSRYGGGGMYNISSSPRLINCAFSANSASNGDVMSNSSSSPTLINCTLGRNGDSGSSISNSSSSPTLTNCIIWGNGDPSIYNYDSASVPVVSYSDIQGGYAGVGNINADPLFVRTPWTGSDGLFATADDDWGDLRLRPGSPVLDIGSNAAIPAGIATDLAGNARIQNGEVDSGAYEGSVRAQAPKTIYVDVAAVGTNTGTSWGDAFTNLQSALLGAEDGDTIRLADGIYKPTNTTDRSISFVLRNGVALYGGYAGYGASDPDARDTGAHPTVLSGEIGNVGDSTDNSYHVVTADRVGTSIVFDGVTVTGGNAAGTGSYHPMGGGLLALYSSLALSNCTFSGNIAKGKGGAMYNSNSSPSLTNCTFSGNSAGQGGAIYNDYSSPSLTNCTFSANAAGQGGAIYNNFSAPTLTNCTFSGNSAMSYGGAMLSQSSPGSMLANCRFSGNTASYGGGVYDSNSSSSPTLVNCTFSGNRATSIGGGMYKDDSSSGSMLTNCTFSGNTAISYGGGMYNGDSNTRLTNCVFSTNTAAYGGGLRNAASPTLLNCTFIGNSGTSYGGGMFNDNMSTPTLNNCTFTGSAGGSSGGGVYNSSASPTLNNCTFTGNAASNGGGMYDSESNPVLANCTFSGNSASNGGGMYNSSSNSVVANCTFSANSASNGGGMYHSSGSPMLTNCIIWENTASSNPQICRVSGTVTVNYSDIQQTSGIYTGTKNINADPLFVRNPSAGTDGTWGTADDDYGDLRPQLTSPVIDAGKNAAVPAGITTDLAGKPRFLDMPGVVDTGLGTAPIVDMGAYERGLVLTTTATGGNAQFSVGLTADHGTLQIWNGTSLQAGPTSSYAVNTVESCEFVGGGDDTLTVDVTNGLPAIGLTFRAGGGKDTLVLTGTTAASSVQVLPGQALVGTTAVAFTDVKAVQLDGTAGSVVDVGSLTVGTNLSLAAGKNLVLRAGTLNITAGGTLDLAGNGMILNYGGASPVATVNQWIGNGRMGITPALKTSGAVASGTAALGMVDNALLHLPSFGGQSLGGVFSQLLIQQTVAGDANLDGIVDDKDYLGVIANMGRTGAQWFMGDLNGDGTVDVGDFAEVSAHVGNRVAALAGISAGGDTGGALVAAGKTKAVAKALPMASKAKAVSKGKVQKAKAKTGR